MVAALSFTPSFPSSGFASFSDGEWSEFHQMGEGEPIVVLPPLAGGVELLRPLLELLAVDHTVYTFQWRGEGRPVFRRNFGFQRLVEDLEEFLVRRRLERPTLLGVSFGGAVAMEYAVQHPRRIGSLIVQGAAANHQDGLFSSIARSMLDRRVLPTDNPVINQFFNVLIGGPRAAGAEFDRIVDRCWRTEQMVISHRLAMLDEFDVRDRLDALTMPTLLLTGERDPFVEVDQARRIADRLVDGSF
ncbi:MAG: alpha/beta fold hydrolase, partial [Planctomycetia bacterium]